MNKREFMIQLSPMRGGVGHVFLTSLFGEASSSFEMPFSEDELNSIHFQLNALGGAAPGDDPEMRPEAIGAKLFKAIFQGDIMKIYQRAMGINPGSEGLIITIKMSPGKEGFDLLHRLPWEMLYDPDYQDFICQREGGAVLRRLAIQHGDLTEDHPNKERLRILLLSASPSDFSQVPTEAQADLLKATIGAHPNCDIVHLSKANWSTISREINEQEYHVIHFFGHGGFNETTGEGYLAFQKEDGGLERISGEAFARLLQKQRKVKLIYLNACNTGQAGNHVDLSPNPFLGVASALILKGFPSVLAMAHPITHEAALSFSGSFYQKYADTFNPLEALTEGRNKLQGDDENSIEWSIPVLFSRARSEDNKPHFNWPFFKKVWTAAGFVVAYLSLWILDNTQKWGLGLPPDGKVSYAATIYGFCSFLPAFITFLILTIYYARRIKSPYWYAHLPEFWATSWNFASPIIKRYQQMGFFWFFVFPAYVFGHLYIKFSHGGVFFDGESPTGGEIRSPISVGLAHWIPSKALLEGHHLFWDSLSCSYDYMYDEIGPNGVDYYPVLFPWMITLVGLWVAYLYARTLYFVFRRHAKTENI